MAGPILSNQTKVCTKCKRTWPISGFYPHYGHECGVNSRCKECCAEENKERYHNKLKLDPKYKSSRSEYARGWHIQNKERNNKRVAEDHRRLRTACLEYYGGKCACCGEDRYEFLAIDHINGGGGKHRKQVGAKMDRWLRRNGYPEGFRVLCHNCNQAISHYGCCPHERKSEQEIPVTLAAGANTS